MFSKSKKNLTKTQEKAKSIRAFVPAERFLVERVFIKNSPFNNIRLDLDEVGVSHIQE